MTTKAEAWVYTDLENWPDISLTLSQIAFDEGQKNINELCSSSELIDSKALRIITWCIPITLGIIFWLINNQETNTAQHWLAGAGTLLTLFITLYFSYQIIKPRQHALIGKLPQEILQQGVIEHAHSLRTEDKQKNYILLSECNHINDSILTNAKMVKAKGTWLHYSLTSFICTPLGGTAGYLLSL